MVDNFVILIRFALIFILSFVFGLQRQKSHKPIGFGTFIFVSVGSCALALTAENLVLPSSIAILSAIITSIGFLGAGALIKTTDKIFGFTTAASIWIFSILGLAIGIGEYLIGFIVYALIWIVVLIDNYLEHRGIGSYQKKIIISTKEIIDEKSIRELLHSTKQKLISMELNKEKETMIFTYLIECTGADLKEILNDFKKYDWFKSYKLE